MKRFLLFILCVCAAISMSAQGLYIDAGGGFGMSSTNYSLEFIEDGWTEYTTGVLTNSGTGYDIGVKAGYGFFRGMPLYLVGDVFWTKESVYKNLYHNNGFGGSIKGTIDIFVDHWFFGPGFVFYPVDNFQFAASIGLVNTDITRKEKIERQHGDFVESYKEKESNNGIGYGFNLSSAVDFGGKSGFLIGGKFSYLDNSVEFKTVEEDYSYKNTLDVSSFYMGIFVKYRFRG